MPRPRVHNVRFLLGLVVLVALSACAQPTATPRPTATAVPTPEQRGEQLQQYSAPPAMTIDPSQTYTATMHTSQGVVVFELFADEAPKTVNNFVFLARDGFYENVIFHRILKGFMVQSGDPTGTSGGGPGYRFEDEPVTRDYLPGTLAMANAGPNTNGSQFFIMHQRMDLPKNYTIFGQVVEGLEVVDALANVPVTTSPSGERSQPVDPPVIERIEITEGAP